MSALDFTSLLKSIVKDFKILALKIAIQNEDRQAAIIFPQEEMNERFFEVPV